MKNSFLILLTCSAAVCAAGWFLCSLSCWVLLRFIEKRAALLQLGRS